MRTTLLTWSVTSRNGQTSASVSLLLVTCCCCTVCACAVPCATCLKIATCVGCDDRIYRDSCLHVSNETCVLDTFATMQTESDCRECCSNLLICCLHYIVLPFHVWQESAGLFNNSQSCKRRRSVKFKSINNSHQRLKETDCRSAEVLFHLSAKSLGWFPQVLCLLSAKSWGRFPEVLFRLPAKSFGREICGNVFFSFFQVLG